MNRFTPEFEELVDLFCEGSMSVEQAVRLESLVGESEEAREYLRESFQIHCELAWEFRRASQDSGPLEPDEVVPLLVGPSPRRSYRKQWLMASAAVAVCVAVAVGLSGIFHNRRPEGLESQLPSPSVAQIEQMQGVRWGGEKAPTLHAPLPIGNKLVIQQGLLEMRFEGGARVIVRGPAEFQLQSPSSAFLFSGSLTAEVPAKARGFTIHTPNATIVDLGTRFGVTCQPEQTEIEVFVGKVLLRLEGTPLESSPQEQTLAANSAVCVVGVPDKGPLKTQSIAVGSRHYVQSMSEPAAVFQGIIESDPHLIHFYPFSGATKAEQLRDWRGNLGLNEVAMRDGDGDGRLAFTRTGPAPSMQVLVPFRAEKFGSTHGRGLQSRSLFQPPPAMTIELLLCFTGEGENAEGFLASAVCVRHDRERCGFLVAAVGSGEFACLLDGDTEWARSGVKFVPGRWYYLASTFYAKNMETVVNVYSADLGNKSPALKWIVKDRVVPGVPASGLLGIGKGFDGEMASAYPWAGQLADVAIYDSVLPRQTLEDHLRAIGSRALTQSGLAPSN